LLLVCLQYRNYETPTIEMIEPLASTPGRSQVTICFLQLLFSSSPQFEPLSLMMVEVREAGIFVCVAYSCSVVTKAWTWCA